MAHICVIKALVRQKNAIAQFDRTFALPSMYQLLLSFSTPAYLLKLYFPHSLEHFVFKNPYEKGNEIRLILKYILCHYEMWKFIFIHKYYDVCICHKWYKCVAIKFQQFQDFILLIAPFKPDKPITMTAT